LAVRYDEVWGLGAQLIVENMSSYPLNDAIAMLGMGVGVGENRAGAVLVENDSSGDYATPTIS
jgi:hypothetical protein